MEIYSLTTVNNGEILVLNMYDPINPMRPMMVEVLRPERHNPNAQIMNYYLWDTQKCNKIEITVFRLLNKCKMGSEIYYFKDKSSLQHYRSTIYTDFNKFPKKYATLLKYLIEAFKEVYG